MMRRSRAYCNPAVKFTQLLDKHVAWVTPTPPTIPTFDLSQCTIIGTDGPDVLTGAIGRDVTCGLGGDDQIRGLGGSGVNFAGAGDDFVSGGASDDTVLGEDGKYTLVGGKTASADFLAHVSY